MNRKGISAAAAVIVFSILFTAINVSCKESGGKIYTESGSTAEGRAAADNSNYNSRQNAITKAVSECSDAIVGINVTEVHEYRDVFSEADELFRYYFGGPRSAPRSRQYEVQGLGSGYIISSDGYIVTNHHVAGNASKIVVTMTDGKKYNAEIIGSDMVSDVTLLKIDEKRLPYLKLGNSDNIITGEWVIAFGNPFGLFDINAKPSVTVGVVSNSGVSFYQEGRAYKNMIQTDAAISSGNSGGPLVNSLGEVIGMNTVIFSTARSNQGAGSIGIGFSIPINRVKQIIDKLREDKKIDRNYITGLSVREINDQIANYFKIKEKDGVIVTQVERNSPGEKGGIEPGDIIVKVKGKQIRSGDDYNLEITDCIAGETIELEINRDGKFITKEIELQPRKK